MDVIKPRSFTYPTDSPFMGESEITRGVAARLEQVQGKVGAALRVGRASGEHLQVLQRILSHQTFVRLDVTPGATLTAMLGNRHVHIPTFNEMAGTVNVAGVKYAPMQHARWDGRAYSTVAPTVELASQLEGLLQQGIKNVGMRGQTTVLQKQLEAWRQESLQHVRMSPLEAGGALPFYLSHQTALTHKGKPGPLFEAARQVEESLSGSIRAAMNKGVQHVQIEGMKTTMERSYALQREVLSKHLAMGLIAFEEGSPFRSSGVKDTRLKGFDVFGNRRFSESQGGRLVYSTLPAHAYGLFFPEQNLPKSIHHMRAAMGMQESEVAAIRAGSGMRSTMPILSAYDVQAQHAASAHMQQMGHSGTAQLKVPVRMLGVRIKHGLSDERGKLARAVMMEMFGDSGFYAGTAQGGALTSINRQFRKASVTTHRGQGEYFSAKLHPLIERQIENRAGGYIKFNQPITHEMLGGEGINQGYLGSSMTSTGEVKMTRLGEEVSVGTRPGEQVRGAMISRGKIRFDIERMGERPITLGTPMVIGHGKRMGLMGVAPIGADVIAAASEGLGVDLSHPDVVFNDLVYRIQQREGQAGLEKVARAVGGEVRLNSAGEMEVVTGLKALQAEHVKNVEQVAMSLGINPGPIVSPETAQLMKMIDPNRGGALMRQHGLGFEDVFDVEERYVPMWGRAGQPKRGSFGRVGLRLRDLRTQSLNWYGQTGRTFDELSSGGKGWRQLKDFTRSIEPGASPKRIRRLSKDLNAYFQATGRTAQKTRDPLAKMAKMHLYHASGDSRLLRGIKVEHLTLEQAKQKFTKALPNIGPATRLEDLVGTHLVETLPDGRVVPSQTFYSITMPSVGAIPESRKTGTGVATNRILLPSGEASGLRAQETLSLSNVEREGLKFGPGHYSLRTYEGIVGGASDDVLYRMSGAGALGAFEAVGSKSTSSGFYKSGSKLKSSFYGTIVKDAKLGAGEMGLSQSTVMRMLKRSGLNQAQAQKRLDRFLISQDKGAGPSFFVHSKTEPARSTSHYRVNKVRIFADEEQLVMRDGKAVTVSASEAVKINPYLLQDVARDVDYDPIGVYNLAGSDPKINFAQEQRAARTLWQTQVKRDQAMLQAANQKLLTDTLKDVGGARPFERQVSLNQYTEILKEAQKLAEGLLGRPMTRTAQQEWMAVSATQVFSPGALTATANIRWRTTTELMRDLAMGRDYDPSKMIYKGGVDMNIADARMAVERLRENSRYVEMIPRLAEASEYATLKKTATEKAMAGGADLATMVDPRLAAITAQLGSFGYADKGLSSALTNTSQAVVDVLKGAEGNPLAWMAQHYGVEAGEEGNKFIGGKIAEMLHASGRLENMGFRSPVQEFMKTAEGKPTTIASTGVSGMLKMLGMSEEAVQGVLDASAFGTMEAGTIGHVSAQAGADALTRPTSVIKGAALQMAAQGKALAQQLWASKWGKPIVMGAGVLGAIGIGKSLFGSSQAAYAPAGAPMPPNPMMNMPQEDRGVDYATIPLESNARIQRVSQVRTHMQVSANGSNATSPFMEMGDIAFGRQGRMPMHGGEYIETNGSGMKDRERVRESVRRRMASEV